MAAHAKGLPVQVWMKVLDFCGTRHYIVVEHVPVDSEEEHRTRMLCEDLRSCDVVGQVSEFDMDCGRCTGFFLSATRWSCFAAHALVATHKAIALDFDGAVLPTQMNAFPNFLNSGFRLRVFFDSTERELQLVFADCRSFQKLTWRWILSRAVPSSVPPLSVVFSRRVYWCSVVQAQRFCERWAV